MSVIKCLMNYSLYVFSLHVSLCIVYLEWYANHGYTLLEYVKVLGLL